MEESIRTHIVVRSCLRLDLKRPGYEIWDIRVTEHLFSSILRTYRVTADLRYIEHPATVDGYPAENEVLPGMHLIPKYLNTLSKARQDAERTAAVLSRDMYQTWTREDF